MRSSILTAMILVFLVLVSTTHGALWRKPPPPPPPPMPRFEKLLNSGKEGVGRCVGLCGKAGAVAMRSGASAGKRVAAACFCANAKPVQSC